MSRPPYKQVHMSIPSPPGMCKQTTTAATTHHHHYIHAYYTLYTCLLYTIHYTCSHLLHILNILLISVNVHVSWYMFCLPKWLYQLAISTVPCNSCHGVHMQDTTEDMITGIMEFLTTPYCQSVLPSLLSLTGCVQHTHGVTQLQQCLSA